MVETTRGINKSVNSDDRELFIWHAFPRYSGIGRWKRNCGSLLYARYAVSRC